MGDENEKIITAMFKNKNYKEIVKEFLNKLQTAEINPSFYIQNKYALDNSLSWSVYLLLAVCGLTASHSQLNLFDFFLNLH